MAVWAFFADSSFRGGLLKSDITPKALLFAVIALFLANAVMLRRGTESLADNFRWVVHTLQVQSAIHLVQGDVAIFNRSVRASRMVPEHPPVDPSLAANLMRDASQVQRLTLDNRSQQRHSGELKTLLDAQVARPVRPPFQPGNAGFETEIDDNTRHIMLLLGAMNAEEADLLRQRQDQTLAAERQINIDVVAQTATQILVAVLVFAFYLRSKQRKEAFEQAGREAHATLMSVLECTSDSVVTVGRDWSLIYGNRQAVESLPDFKLGADYWACFPAVLGTPTERYLRTAMVDRRPAKFENSYLPYGCSYRVEIFPVEQGVNIFFYDITEERRMQTALEVDKMQRELRIEELDVMTAELAGVNELLTSVMDSSSDGIIKIDSTWRIHYGNRVAMASLADFRVDADFWECFPALVSTHAEERLLTAMRDRVETNYEIFYGPYSGWYAVRVFPTGDGVSLFFSNITEEKKLRVQLEHEQLMREKRIEALSHMAGGLAHEISNPLAIIHGRATELLDLAAGEVPVASDEVRVACEDIVKTSNRASSILRGLRGFGREASQDEMQLASIYDIAEESVELQHSRFERHGVELRVRLDPELPLLLCRATQIGQILTNLLNNGFDAIVQAESVARWVEMTAVSDGESMIIEVTDSGPGIEDHFKTHLMEAFFTTKEFGVGMGIGLSLSRAMAQDHGGTLTLCSDRENTCFQLILPIVGDSAAGYAEPALVGVSH